MPADSAFVARDPAAHPAALTPIYKTSVFRAPHRPLLSLEGSLSEVTGPVFGQHELGPLDADLVRNYARDGGAPVGERIIVHGRVLDGSARPVPGVLLEFWQANAAGRYRHRNDNFDAPIDPNFGGCGRCLTDAEGRYATQMYFEGDPLIRHDSIMATVADPAARERLVALLDLNASVPLHTLAYRWDIVLRGARSTVFENRPEGN